MRKQIKNTLKEFIVLIAYVLILLVIHWALTLLLGDTIAAAIIIGSLLILILAHFYKSNKTKERHFIVYFSFDGGNGNYLIMTDGHYVNRIEIIKRIKDKAHCNVVTIANIIELSESDYNDFCKKEEEQK